MYRRPAPKLDPTYNVSAMLHLDIVEPQGRRTIAVSETDSYLIGRSSECQLQLSDAQVSRRHCELRHVASGWLIRDCGSRFGTFLNNQRVGETDTPLRPGDRLRVGQTEVHVADPASSQTASAAFDFRQMNALLASLRALGSTQVLGEVLAIVLDAALDVTGAERGFILLAGAEAKLELMLARARGGVTLPTAQTSQRIPERVFATGVDEVVADLHDDEHAAMHMGTVALGIRHVLCTPLTVASYAEGGAAKRIGVLYLDSRDRGHLQQLVTLRALAAQAAVVIENARLYREVVERERTAQELRIAARIQQALLPPAQFTGASVTLAAKTTPCRDVGGDFFDYQERDTGFSFVLGDVAGKGTSAALLTAVIQGLFAAEAEAEDPPATVLRRVNRALCRRAIDARFVTGFYGQIVNGTLRYCNAGHNAPFLFSNGGLQRLETGGCVMGLFDTAAYESAEVPCAPGDLLVVFSDGVTEAVNADGDELGDDRLHQCLEAVRDRPVWEVLTAVEREARAFAGSVALRDDLTVMVIRVN